MGERKPNIKSLVRREDVDGLIAAATYQDLAPTSEGTVSDLGIPIRVDAILALGTLAPEQGRGVIAAALRDPADRVRCAAVRVLHKLQEVGVLAEALQWLPPQRGHSYALASRAILDLRESVRASAVADGLIQREDDDLLSDEDAELILALLEDQGADATDEVLELLIIALGDERGIVVDRAAELLVRLAPTSIEPLVAELRGGLNSADAAYVLGRIGDPETLDVLVKALKHRDARVRAETAAALGELEDPAAVKPLLRVTHDPNHAVRSQARMALDRMGTVAVIEGVAELLRPVVRDAVRSAFPKPDDAVDGGKPQPRSAARKRSRSKHSNGGPPESARPPTTPQEKAEKRSRSTHSNGGPPRSAHPPATPQEKAE
jgi:HEAT repeat protein